LRVSGRNDNKVGVIFLLMSRLGDTLSDGDFGRDRLGIIVMLFHLGRVWLLVRFVEVELNDSIIAFVSFRDWLSVFL